MPLPILFFLFLSVCETNAALQNCSNNFLDIYEQCDDGNLTNGDGCSSLCQKEGDDFPVVLYQDDGKIPLPNIDDLPLITKITQHGITWTFSELEHVGRFVNGDYYVVGEVTITDITPSPTTVNGRHGSMLNMQPNLQKSGFDDRIIKKRYDPNLRVYPPIVLSPGNALISSRSINGPNLQRVMRPNDTSLSPVASNSVLTSTNSPQPFDTFRPSYAKGSNNIYYSRNLKRELLPKLPLIPTAPSITEFENYLKRPWIDSVFFGFAVPSEYMPNYGREYAYTMSFSGLLLTLHLPQEQKEPLLVYLTQLGIDLYGLVEQGHDGWNAHGGHGHGRKFPIVFAGLLLNEKAIYSVQANFSEDVQTAWVGDTPPTGTYFKTWHSKPQNVVYAGHKGINGESDRPGWGPYEHLNPFEWQSTLGESYRRCCTSVSWVGEALAARLIPGMQRLWNHPPFFAYIDRWMFTPDDPNDLDTIKNATGMNIPKSFRQGQSWKILSGGGYKGLHTTFVDDMWDAYREYSPTDNLKN